DREQGVRLAGGRPLVVVHQRVGAALAVDGDAAQAGQGVAGGADAHRVVAGPGVDRDAADRGGGVALHVDGVTAAAAVEHQRGDAAVVDHRPDAPRQRGGVHGEGARDARPLVVEVERVQDAAGAVDRQRAGDRVELVGGAADVDRVAAALGVHGQRACDGAHVGGVVAGAG